ncbi:MAG: hypothetical protein U0361_13145 [Nitrospiraceae bacterium]
MKSGFFRGHGLGSDYLVMDPKELSFKLTPKAIRAICDRNCRASGSDGILALVPSKKADFGLRIYNPDGSEAEKSGSRLPHLRPLSARDRKNQKSGHGRYERRLGVDFAAGRSPRRPPPRPRSK